MAPQLIHKRSTIHSLKAEKKVDCVYSCSLFFLVFLFLYFLLYVCCYMQSPAKLQMAKKGKSQHALSTIIAQVSFKP